MYNLTNLQMERTIEQLKAYAYDLLVQSQQINNELAQVNQMISGKLQEEKKAETASEVVKREKETKK